jgi:hypothetical protein
MQIRKTSACRTGNQEDAASLAKYRVGGGDKKMSQVMSKLRVETKQRSRMSLRKIDSYPAESTVGKAKGAICWRLIDPHVEDGRLLLGVPEADAVPEHNGIECLLRGGNTVLTALSKKYRFSRILF